MKKLKIAIGFLLGALLLYLFLRSVDVRQVWNVILQGNPAWLALAVSAIMASLFVRALRWRYLLLPIKKCGIWNLFKTTMIGFGISAVIPARVGEVVRPYMLGNKENISKSSALATIVVERLFDTLTVLLMLVVYLLLLMTPGELNPEAAGFMMNLKKTGLIIFAGVLLLFVFLFYLKSHPSVAKGIARKFPGRFAQTIEEVLLSFVEGLSILKSPKILLQVTAWSFLFWLVVAVSFWATVRAYLPAFSFSSTFLIMIMLAIGIAIPTPGGVGGYHWACKIGLTTFFNAPETEAGAIALVSHFINIAPVLVIGLLFLWHEGIASAKEVTSEKPAPDRISGE